MDEDDLEKIKWKKFSRGNAEWTYSDLAEKLATKLKENGGSLKIGDYVYELRHEKFIVRIKLKKMRARLM